MIACPASRGAFLCFLHIQNIGSDIQSSVSPNKKVHPLGELFYLIILTEIDRSFRVYAKTS